MSFKEFLNDGSMNEGMNEGKYNIKNSLVSTKTGMLGLKLLREVDYKIVDALESILFTEGNTKQDINNSLVNFEEFGDDIKGFIINLKKDYKNIKNWSDTF